MPTTRTAASNSNVDVQSVIDISAAGDTAFIPFGSGSVTWNSAVNVPNKNIKLLGAAGTISTGTMVRIIASPTLESLIHYTCEDTSRFTAEIGNLELYGQNMTHKLWVDGTATISQAGQVYSGGCSIHDIRFNTKRGTFFDGVANGTTTYTSATAQFDSLDVGKEIFGPNIPPPTTGVPPVLTVITQVNSPTSVTMSSPATGSGTGLPFRIERGLSGQHLVTQGWVFGVIWHCEIAEDLDQSGDETQTFNHDAPPGGSPAVMDNGDYSRFQVPASGLPIIDSLEQWVCEDNIWHHAGACTDSTSIWGGGSRMLCRHNTHWGMMANHGTRDTGDPASGGRTVHHYNNHFVRVSTNAPYLKAAHKLDRSPAAARDGECVFINNFITVQTGGAFSNATNWWCTPSAAANSNNQSSPRFNYAMADGLNPWDENQSGSFDDPLGGYHHDVFALYSFTGPTDASLFSADNKSHVVNGVDVSDTSATTGPSVTRSYMSDVYATVTGGMLGVVGGNLTLSNVVISGTNVPNDVTGYFDGFTVRNPNLQRADFVNKICNYTMIEHSTGTIANATLTLSPIRPNNNAFPFGYDPVIAQEIRKVKTYWSVPGKGRMLVSFKPGMLETLPAVLTDGTKRFVEGPAGGIWIIGNMRRIGNTDTWLSELTQSRYQVGGRWYHVGRDYHQLLGYANTYPNVNAGIRPGYPWDKTLIAGPGNPDTRVGADWYQAWSLLPVNSVLALPVEFQSFFINGGVTSTHVPYPHPLRQAPSSTAPRFSSKNSANFTAGVAFEFTVSTDGFPIPTIAASNLPGGGSNASSFTPSSPADGTGVFAWANPVAGTYSTIQFTAVNIAGTTNQDFTLVVTSPSVEITAPANNTTVTQPATVNITADASSGNGITKVEFYQGTTLLGTDTAAPYSFVWSGMADGTYSLTAKAYDLVTSFVSTAVSVTIQTGVVIPPAPASIHIRA